jgi:hypothetical protein
MIQTSRRTAAPPEAVWQVLADISTWKDWGPYQDTHLEREGDPAPDGIGAIRVYVVGPIKSREEVTVFDPPRRFGYRILSGFPARDYNSLVTLDAIADGGTNITWRSEFDGKPRGTGWIMRIGMVPYLMFLARMTGRVAARRAATARTAA